MAQKALRSADKQAITRLHGCLSFHSSLRRRGVSPERKASHEAFMLGSAESYGPVVGVKRHLNK